MCITSIIYNKIFFICSQLNVIYLNISHISTYAFISINNFLVISTIFKLLWFHPLGFLIKKSEISLCPSLVIHIKVQSLSRGIRKKWKKGKNNIRLAQSIGNLCVHSIFAIRGSLKMTDEGTFEVITVRFLRTIDVELIWLWAAPRDRKLAEKRRGERTVCHIRLWMEWRVKCTDRKSVV